jgi:ribosomal protein S18 acetylase RimI-like enzyme
MALRDGIRRARASDIPRVLALWRSPGIPPSKTDDEDSLALLLRHPTAVLLAAEHDGNIIGSVIAGWDGWRGELYRLAVAPNYRRCGLGTLLVREAEACLIAEGAGRINILVLHESDGASAFWEACGYVPDERLGRYVRSASHRLS